MSLADLEDRFIDDDEFIEDDDEKLEEEEEEIEEEEEEEETETEKELRELNEYIEQHEKQYLRRSTTHKASGPKKKSSLNPNEKVIIEIPALLRLFKACSETKPDQVRGDLLGYDGADGTTLHITALIPQNRGSRDLVKTLSPDELSQLNPEEAYSAAALARYRALHVACDAVGTFECSAANLAKTDFVDRQAARQLRENARCVVLVFDPAAAAQMGTLSLRALRLSDAFMDLYRAARDHVDELYAAAEARGADEEELAGIPGPMGSAVFASGTRTLAAKDLYVEIPVEVRGSIPQRQFAKKAGACGKVLVEDSIEAYAYLERNLNTLGDVFGSLAASANFYNKSLGKATAESMQLSFFNLMAQEFQVASYCDKVDTAANVAESKLYMVSGLQKDDE